MSRSGQRLSHAADRFNFWFDSFDRLEKRICHGTEPSSCRVHVLATRPLIVSRHDMATSSVLPGKWNQSWSRRANNPATSITSGWMCRLAKPGGFASLSALPRGKAGSPASIHESGSRLQRPAGLIYRRRACIRRSRWITGKSSSRRRSNISLTIGLVSNNCWSRKRALRSSPRLGANCMSGVTPESTKSIADAGAMPFLRIVSGRMARCSSIFGTRTSASYSSSSLPASPNEMLPGTSPCKPLRTTRRSSLRSRRGRRAFFPASPPTSR